MDLKKKVVLVTGSSSGIGRETALMLAEKGAYVIITYNKNRKGGEEVFDACSLMTKCLLLKLNTMDKKSITDAVQKIKRKFGKVDILINNAGIIFRKPFHLQTFDEIETQVETNLLGGMRVTRLTMPLLSRKALIINLGSLKSRFPAKRMVPYCASKFGVRGFTQTLALELPKDIKVCLLNPSPTATRMHYFEGDNPKDVADVIVRVAEEKIKYKNGNDIDVKDYIKKRYKHKRHEA